MSDSHVNRTPRGASTSHAVSPQAIRNALLVLLAATSGYIDAVSYLGLEQVFTANMTGNTVLLGLALGQARWLAALRSGAALAAFLFGGAIGELISGTKAGRALWPSRVNAALAVECLVLVAFAVGGQMAGTEAHPPLLYALISLSAIAMGLQSTAVRTLGVTGITSTYITGTWLNFVSGALYKARSLLSGTSTSDPEQSPSSGIGLQATVLLVYGLGAVVGGAAKIRWSLDAAWVPWALVALVVVVAHLKLRDSE